MNRIFFIIFLLSIMFGPVVSQTAQSMSNEKDTKAGYKVHYDKDGKTKLEEGNYIDNQKDGLWKSYFSDGKIKHEITYIKGAAKGYAKMYYSNGNIREEGTWNESCWTGDYRYYYPNGQIAYEWRYNQHGKREGEQKYYYENGNIKYNGNWENGHVKTSVEVYDSLGTFVQSRVYENGTFAESVKTKPADPELTSPPINNNTSHLLFNGTGEHTIYRLDMQIDEKGYYEKGKLIKGEKYIYDEQGKLRQIRIYEKGEMVKVNPVTQ